MWRLCLLFPLALWGAYEGSPAMPVEIEEGVAIADTKWYAFRIGGVQEWVYQLRMHGGGHRATVYGWDALVTFDWTVGQRFDLEGRIGRGALSGQWREGDVAVEMEGAPGLLWGGAAKIVFLESGDTSLGAQVQGGGWSYLEGRITLNGVPQAPKSHSELLFWQASVGIAQKVGWTRPYAALVVDQFMFKTRRAPGEMIYFQERHRIGGVLGVDLTTGTYWLLALESRMGFEEVLALSLQLRF